MEDPRDKFVSELKKTKGKKSGDAGSLIVLLAIV